MAYPTYLARITSYLQADNAGQDLSYANMDTEGNNTVAVVNAINNWLRGITDSTGHLVNLAAATAEALAGAERFVATAAQTVFDTAITWDSSFTNLNVPVYVNGTMLDPTLVTVADNSGSLRVTIPARTVGDVVVVEAFSSGAGILTRIQSTANAQGASLVGLEDAGTLYTAATAEAAFAEVMTKLNLLITNIGTIANYLKKDGTVAMTASFNAGTQKIINLLDGTNNTDAVTVGQLVSATASLNELYTQFVNKDGSVAMTGPLNMGSQKITNLTPGVAATDAATVSQIAGNNSPTGLITMFGGLTAPSGWVLCDGQTYDGTSPTYSALYAILQNRFGGTGAAAFKVPNFNGMVPMGGGASQTYTDAITATSKTTTARSVGTAYGEETHVLTVAELAAHSHTVSSASTGGSGGLSESNVGSPVTTSSVGSNTAHNNIQPSLGVNFIIKL